MGVDFATLLNPELLDDAGGGFVLDTPRTVGGLPLNKLVKKLLRTRAPDARLLVIEQGTAHLWFKFVQGGWITSRAYMVDTGDDVDDVIDVVVRAIRDLAADQARYPAV